MATGKAMPKPIKADKLAFDVAVSRLRTNKKAGPSNRAREGQVLEAYDR